MCAHFALLFRPSYVISIRTLNNIFSVVCMCLSSASSSSCAAKDQNHAKVRDKYMKRMKDKKKIILSSILFVVGAVDSIVCLYVY